MEAKMPLHRIGKLLKTVLKEIDARGGEVSLRDVLPTAEAKLDLSDYEKEKYEKTGYIRWVTFVHFYSIDCVKAGYLRKAGGKWILTDEGRKALKLSDEDFMRSAHEKYKEWAKERGPQTKAEVVEEEEDTDKIVRQAAYEQAYAQARAEIEEHITRLDPYDFQNVVAELLTAMGYHVTYVAPPGPDSGVDIIAYNDPLGTSQPRIKIQVKHRPGTKVPAKEVRELQGILNDGDIGLFVSTGGFTPESEKTMRTSAKQIEFIDLDRLITLWCRHYEKISEAGKAYLPLVKVFFLAPVQE